MEKRLKKTDFIRKSRDQGLNRSVLRILNRQWSEVLENPEVITVDNLSEKELKSLARMNLDVFTKKALKLNGTNGPNDNIEYVFKFIFEDVRKELEQML